ncbi:MULTISPECIES: hypothetical protein [unclassified Microcoleus]|uniref:hypothetical protein n=1 Tax=unclassified Microcoleus TaxID=2642155 RepID=UPI0025DDACCA|nr:MULTISPECIES: hypothetical protein [unclassified Microcoleus]
MTIITSYFARLAIAELTAWFSQSPSAFMLSVVQLYQRLFVSAVMVFLSYVLRTGYAYGIGQPSHLNKPGFHPTPICKRYDVGIPAELAKAVKILH